MASACQRPSRRSAANRWTHQPQRGNSTAMTSSAASSTNTNAQHDNRSTSDTPRADAAGSHDASLAARICSQQMQQRRERGCDLDSESCLADPGRSRDRHGADVAVQQQLPQQRKLPCPFPPARSLRGDSSLPSPCSEPASLDRSARRGRSGAARTQAWGHPEPRRHSSPPIATGTVHSVSRTVRPAGRHHVSCSHE